MSQTKLAEELGVSKQLISMLIQGERNISDSLALGLGEYTGKGPIFWLNLQRDYDAWVLSKEGRDHIRNEMNAQITTNWDLAGPRILVDEEIEIANDCGLIAIDPIIKENLQAASYDFLIGSMLIDEKMYYNTRCEEYDPKLCNGFSDASIKRGQSSSAYTLEKLGLDDRIVGRLGITNNSVVWGISVLYGSQIKPGFGKEKPQRLTVRVDSLNEDALKCFNDHPLLSAEFTYLSRIPKRNKSVTMGSVSEGIEESAQQKHFASR